MIEYFLSKVVQPTTFCLKMTLLGMNIFQNSFSVERFEATASFLSVL